jgi:hypothetical protein
MSNNNADSVDDIEEHLFSNVDVDEGEVASVELLNLMMDQLDDYDDDAVFMTVEELRALLKSHMNAHTIIKKLQS